MALAEVSRSGWRRWVLYVDGGMLAQLRSPQVDTPLPDSVKARLRETR